MKFYVQQTIQIQMIKIGSVSNSSVFQIGTAGSISESSNLYNTGGYIKPAPEAVKPGTVVAEQGAKQPPIIKKPLVPFQPPASPV
ncbi:spore germination protein GerPB [Falsibacillus albus]|uniref:Spore gernimation protein n=1 Tax=Falsibacillus albus TaxID=2478915 RepID=A0A3L7K599_9BACI|nr:spore germination protein GerPB [Falsibacillus albus]RLQ97241.1 spore gernimation protein [Falsibacillus albus]